MPLSRRCEPEYWIAVGVDGDRRRLHPGCFICQRDRKGNPFRDGFHHGASPRCPGTYWRPGERADYLADDYELGHRVWDAGLEIVLADCIVDHYLPRYSWADFFQHQL